MKFKQLTAGFLAALLTSLSTASLAGQALYTDDGAAVSRNITSHQMTNGYRPTQLPSNQVSKLAKNAALPDSYDPRGHKTMTSVKNQGVYGTCWSFSSIASIESSLFDYDPYVDLSEWYQATYLYQKEVGYPLVAPESGLYEQGGMLESCAAFLLRGMGPVYESDCTYGNESAADEKLDAAAIMAQADYRVTDVTYFPYCVDDDNFEAQKNAIKLALSRGQELSVSYLDHEEMHDDEHHSYYFPREDEEKFWESYGHAVNLVGWDDHFPAENFVTPPAEDGAWLVKNSWGEEFGEQGYFWMSYCESSLCDITAYTAVPAQTYSDVYQYDLYGYGASLASVEIDPECIASQHSDSAMMANIFTAEKDTMLTAVMAATAMPDENYEITVYTGITNPADPTSGTAHSAASGIMPQTGYHTIPLTQPVTLTKGESFSVVVKLSGEMGNHLTGEVSSYGVYAGSDGTEEKMGSAASADELDDILENQSFISLDGKKWEDMSAFRVTQEYEVEFSPESLEPDADFVEYLPKSMTYMYGNVCIKALTCDADKVDFSVYADTLAMGDTIALSNAGNLPIYYAINDGEMQPYTEPIVFSGDMTIRARTENSENIYEKSYRHRTAAFDKLQVSEYLSNPDEYFQYISFHEENGTFVGEYHYTVITPGEWFPDTLAVRPFGAVEVICNGQKIPCNEFSDLSIDSETPDRALVFQVSGEGLADAEYVVRLVEELAPLQGDVNIDGEVDAKDAAEILVLAAEIAANGMPEDADDSKFFYFDVNWDGEVNALDATWVLVKAAEEGAQ